MEHKISILVRLSDQYLVPASGTTIYLKKTDTCSGDLYKGVFSFCMGEIFHIGVNSVKTYEVYNFHFLWEIYILQTFFIYFVLYFHIHCFYATISTDMAHISHHSLITCTSIAIGIEFSYSTRNKILSLNHIYMKLVFFM